MFMEQGNFHIVDNDLKFNISQELANLPKSTELQLNWFEDIIIGNRFFTHTNSESYLNRLKSSEAFCGGLLNKNNQ